MRGRSAVSLGVAWLDLTNFEHYAWFSLASAVAAGPGHAACSPGRPTNQGPSLGRGVGTALRA